MFVKVLSASVTWPVSAEMSFFTAVTSFSSRSTVALSSMLFFPNSRFVCKQMLFQDQRDHRQRRGNKSTHRPPQPGPERQRQQHRERIEREPAPDDGRRDEMTFEEGQGDKQQRRDQPATQRRERDNAD